MYCTREQELTWDPVAGHLGGEGEEPAHEGQLGRVVGGQVPHPAVQVRVVALRPLGPAVCSVQAAVYSVQCALFSMQRIVCSIKCAVHIL